MGVYKKESPDQNHFPHMGFRWAGRFAMCACTLFARACADDSDTVATDKHNAA